MIKGENKIKLDIDPRMVAFSSCEIRSSSSMDAIVNLKFCNKIVSQNNGNDAYHSIKN